MDQKEHGHGETEKERERENEQTWTLEVVRYKSEEKSYCLPAM